MSVVINIINIINMSIIINITVNVVVTINVDVINVDVIGWKVEGMSYQDNFRAVKLTKMAEHEEVICVWLHRWGRDRDRNSR